MRHVSPCGRIELRCGDYREVLADVERCDAVVCDPPYSERTHRGHRAGLAGAGANGMRIDKRTGSAYRTGNPRRRDIGYGSFDIMDAAELAGFCDRASGWAVILTSHDMFHCYDGQMGRHGRYVFHPIPLVIPGMTVRLAGDGPSSWCVWACVSRTKAVSKWGTLPGAYVVPSGTAERCDGVVGGKPLALMRALVRDYTRPGDLVVDPCAGGATTLIAAAIEGRRAIGAELDSETYEKAVARIQRGYTPDLFGG